MLPVTILLIAVLAGCAKVQPYRPAPIAPVDTAHRLEARRLTAPGLGEYIEKALGHPVSRPMRQWDLQTLTLAALYFSPQMEISSDRLAVAQGAITTAAERPNPTVSLKPAIPSPYLFGLSLVFPIETHGKRALRIEQAKFLSSAAKIALAETAWKVSSGVRKALLAYQMAQERLALDQNTEKLETQQVALLDRMLTAGEGSRPNVQTARLALSNVRFVIRADEGQVAITRTALAGSIGVPVAAFDGIQITWPNFGRLPTVAELSPHRIQRDAVLNRLDVHRALEQYAAADAALRLQIAKQYPDFDIGPGYTFEEGDSFFAIPFSLVLPILNRNQGPIAQAEAFRKEEAANFLAVQARTIAQSEQALAGYRSALAELNQANRPIEAQRLRVQMIQRAVAAGENGRLQLNSVLLEGIVYARQRLEALAQAQAALGALEDAVEKPLGPDAIPSPTHAAAAAVSGRKEFDR